jgi:hypothetical protein
LRVTFSEVAAFRFEEIFAEFAVFNEELYDGAGLGG